MKQVISFLIISVVITYSGGFSISQHFCANELKSTSINSTVEGCHGMAKREIKTGITKSTCCLDEHSFYQTFEYEDEKEVSIAPILSFDIKGLEIPFISFKAHDLLENYSLPPPKLAVYKKVQRYLI